MTKEKTKFTPVLEKATGEIKYNMTNDYMFRALFQQNTVALKGAVKFAAAYATGRYLIGGDYESNRYRRNHQ